MLQYTVIFLNEFIGSQNHIGFKCTAQQNIICTLHHAPISQAKSLSVPFSCFVQFYLSPPFPSVYPHTVVHVSVLHICIPHTHTHVSYMWGGCLIPSPTFIHPPKQPSPLRSFSLFHASMPLFLFCLLVYFVLSILHISEIIWYLSFSDWLTSLSIILSRSIHAVAEDKISLFFTAE